MGYMPVVDKRELANLVKMKYGKAKMSVFLQKSLLLEKTGGAISDRIPSHPSRKLEFEAFIRDRFAVLFADMRKSTQRALEIGPENTFLTMHAIIPALIFVVEKYKGSIIDLPGDGVMALFKKNNNIRWEGGKGGLLNKESLSVRCGQVLLETFDEIVNPILIKDAIPPVCFGVGIDSGDVIVTKIGTVSTYDIKAIGNCINIASKLSDGDNETRISPAVHSLLPIRLREEFEETKNKGDKYFCR